MVKFLASRYEFLIIMSLLLVFLSILIIRCGYPLTYSVIVVLLPLVLVTLKFDNALVRATLALFLSIAIGHNASYFILPDKAQFENFVGQGEHVNLAFDEFIGLRSFAILDNTWLYISSNLPYLQHSIYLISSLLVYISLYLFLSLFKSNDNSKSILLIIFVIIGFYGFGISVAFALLALYYLLKDNLKISMPLFIISVFFGTRGLIAFGVIYLVMFLKKASYRYKLLLAGVTLGVIFIILPYVTGYLKIVSIFLQGTESSQINKLISNVVNFYTRERLQPWHDFAVVSSTFLGIVLLGLVYSIKRRLFLFLLNILILTSLFIITFIGRVSYFENPASDIPYYFLYAAIINSVVVLYLARAKPLVFAILLLLLIGALVPKYGYVTYYEHTFNKLQEYYALVSFIHTFGERNSYVYDYGSYPFRKYIPNGNLIQPWQDPFRHFSGRYYIYSKKLQDMKMFFTLPTVQKSLTLIVSNNVVYDAGQYGISQVRR